MQDLHYQYTVSSGVHRSEIKFIDFFYHFYKLGRCLLNHNCFAGRGFLQIYLS